MSVFYKLVPPRICRQGYSFSKRGTSQSSLSQCCRSCSSPSVDEKQDAATKDDSYNKLDVKSLADFSSRGIGQVLFLNCPTSGLFLLGGLALGDPYLSVLAATGAGTATATASLAGLDKGALKDGLWGYNGCLVGCAAAVFVNPLPAIGWTTVATLGLATTMVGSAATPFVAAALKPACGSVPQFTLAFNMVTLTMLLRSRPLLPASAEETTSTEAVTIPTIDMGDVLLHAPWKGISQIFVVESTLAGAAVLGGIAYYSRGLAAHTLLGSSIGAATGAMLGADMSSLSIGLGGFNSALTSLGVGVFLCILPKL